MRHPAKLITLAAALLVAGCGSDDSSFNYGYFNPSPTVSAPTAVADSFTTLGNSVLTASVTANDTVNGATVSSFQNPSNSGGTVAISGSGALTYTPPLNSTNITDTFTYTLSNSVGASTATVTVQVGARGLFVKNDVAATGTGTQNSPFKTLAEAVTAATGINGAQIVIFRGDGGTTGLNTPVTLTANQGIQGQDPANPPVLTGPVFLSSGNALKDLNFQATVPAAINGTNASSGTLTALNVSTTGSNAAVLNNATGAWTINNSRFANANFTLLANCSTGTLTWTVNNCTFSNGLTDIVGNLTAGGGATQTLIVTNNTINPRALGEAVACGAFATSTNMTLTINNNTVNGGGTVLRGLDIQSQSTCNVTASAKNNIIAGCTAQGILVSAADTSTCAARINNNTLTGNNLGGLVHSLTAGSTSAATLKLALDGNTANTYLVSGQPAFQATMESLATLLTRNTGTFTTANLVDGPCPAP